MKMSKAERKKIEQEVKKYIKTLVIKDEQGNIIASGLVNNRSALIDLYQQPFFIAYSDEERFIAKQFFKDHLPYKEWRDMISKRKGLLAQEIEDFQEEVDPRYQRITSRGRKNPNIYIGD